MVADVSNYTRAEFFNFLFILLSKKAKLKNLADFANTHKPLGKPVIAMFYIRCCTQAFIFSILDIDICLQQKLNNVTFSKNHYFP